MNNLANQTYNADVRIKNSSAEPIYRQEEISIHMIQGLNLQLMFYHSPKHEHKLDFISMNLLQFTSKFVNKTTTPSIRRRLFTLTNSGD